MRTAGEGEKGWDVAVVGGGVVGLAAARSLARRGARVCLFEAGEAGGEASWAAGGMLAPQAEADCDDDFFRLQRASLALYPDFADALRDETGRDVELDRTGTLYVGFGETDERELAGRYAWQRAAGLPVERLTGAEARRHEPSLSPRAALALRFPEDWQVENRRLAEALRESCERLGVALRAGVRVEAVRVRGGRAAGVETRGVTTRADAVVLAAGAWSSRVPLVSDEGVSDEGDAVGASHPRVVPVRGQMLCFEQEAAAPRARHVVYSPRGYLVPRRDGRLLAGSTTEEAGFDKRVTGAGVHAILTHALELSPCVGQLRLTDAWAGLRPRADDGLPVIGESAQVGRLFYATGHYRNGILLAPLTAELLAGMVLGGADASASAPFRVETFSPARFAAGRAAGTAQAKVVL